VKRAKDSGQTTEKPLSESEREELARLCTENAHWSQVGACGRRVCLSWSAAGRVVIGH
jgi:hypothetical protein